MDDPLDDLSEQASSLFHDALENIKELKRQVGRHGPQADRIWTSLKTAIDSPDDDDEAVNQPVTPQVDTSKREQKEKGGGHRVAKRIDPSNEALEALYETTKFPTLSQKRELAAAMKTTVKSIKDRFDSRRSIRGDTRHELLNRAFSDDPDPNQSDLLSICRQTGLTIVEVNFRFEERRHALLDRAFQVNAYPDRRGIATLSTQTGLSFAGVEIELASRRRGNSTQQRNPAPRFSTQASSSKGGLKRTYDEMEDEEDDLAESYEGWEKDDDDNEEEGDDIDMEDE